MMKLDSTTGDNEEVMAKTPTYRFECSSEPVDSLESICLPSSCAVDFTKLEGQTLPLLHDQRSQFNCLDNEVYEEDDENFENDGDAFDNYDNDDDDADAHEGRSSRGKWTAEEDETLRDAVQRHSGRNWKKISDCLDGRTDVQCLHRWQKVLRPGLIKGPWTKEVCSNGNILNYFRTKIVCYPEF